jgi:hypothetical protein
MKDIDLVAGLKKILSTNGRLWDRCIERKVIATP